jgi:hypothetical protein
MKRTTVFLCLLGLATFACMQPGAEEAEISAEDFLGSWDVTVQGQNAAYPSWFEITRREGELKGEFVGRVGSVRPIQKIEIEGDQLVFSLPVQYESNPQDLEFDGQLTNVGQKTIVGTTYAADGSTLNWTAVPAPSLERTGSPSWGEPIDLTSGSIGDYWHVRSPDAVDKWSLSDGVLVNAVTGTEGTDLITNQKFEDFKLHIEFNCPKDSNSGVYLRGRYEVQILSGPAEDPTRGLGGVYGFLAPSVDAAKPAGEWQTYDITLVGRRVTIDLNGQRIINDKEIPGITGGALNSDEGAPGPIMLQGDHGPVSFRNIVLTPAQ